MPIIDPSFISRQVSHSYTSTSGFEIRRVYGDEARLVLREALLPIYTPKNTYDVVKPPEAIYYSVYKKGSEYAAFLLYVWNEQVLPPHKYDYEPVIVFLDQNLNVKEVYTDGFHYYVQKFKAPPLTDVKPHIRINTPWRAMEVSWSEPPRNYIMIYPIDETQGDLPRTKIKYLSDHVISELKNREVNPLAVHGRLIKNPWSVKDAKHWATIREPTASDLLNDFSKNYRVSRVDLFIEKAKLFIKSMAETAKLVFLGLVNRARNGLVREKDEYDFNTA